MHDDILRTYSYVFFGPEKVGKTNLITRLTKDQFTQAHNITLEGQQTAILTIDQRSFQIHLHDTAGQQNMVSMKAVWRSGKNGYIFTFAINSYESFNQVIDEIQQIKKQPLYRNVASILLGNKKDLETDRQVQLIEAQAKAQQMGIKYLEVSAKASFKEQIEKVFHELVDMNEMERFQSATSFQHASLLSRFLSPCDRERCSLI